MNRRHSPLFVAVIIVTTLVLAHGQQSPPIGSTAAGAPTQIPAMQAPAAVPPFLPLSGALVDQSGKAIAGPVEITLAVYLEREGGAPLWSEVQTVHADQRGQYSLALGAASSSGIPVSVFASGGVRWLGVSPAGQTELARTPILSVPYALKAGDAETLGGKPASAFLTATGNQGEAAASPGSTASNSAPAPTPPSPSAPSFTATANPGPGFISQATSGPPLQVSSSAAVANLNADMVDGFHAAAFPKLATANTFAGTQTIDTGNLDLDPSTATTGSLTKNGARFLHNFGASNTFLGLGAGNFSMTGQGNTGSGTSALINNTTGDGNTAFGSYALFANTSGGVNIAVGSSTLFSNTTGSRNTATGNGALNANTTGSDNSATGHAALARNLNGNRNTGSGYQALFWNTGGVGNTATGADALQNTTGSNNVGVGQSAGFNATSGSNNIYLGANVQGVAGESNSIYLGQQGTQTKTVIAGIWGTTVTGAEAVLIDANGRLGSGSVAPPPNSVGSAQVIDDSLTASDLGPDSVTTSELAPDSVTAAKVAFNYAGSASEGGAAADLACVGCVAASEVSFSFASLGANTFTATQTIDTGNVDLDPSTATTGNITKNGAPFLHNAGTNNTFVGVNAGSLGTSGFGGNTAVGVQALSSLVFGGPNTAVGFSALAANTSGTGNTGVGFSALTNNASGSENTGIGGLALNSTTGNFNTALGSQALRYNTTGSQNTGIGRGALSNSLGSFNTAVGSSANGANTSGQRNTVVGQGALFANTTGSDNVAVGVNAGTNATTGSNNIYVGSDVQGVAGESNTMYLGGTQTKTVIAGIRGTTVTGGEAVLIDANGRLGSGPVAPGANSVGSAEVIDDSLTANDLAPDSVSTSELATGSVTADKVAFNYAGSSSAGGPATDLACIGCVAASEVSFSFASLGANTFTATQTIDTGNLDLDASTATAGNITKNGAPFLHNFGTQNTFLGANAGNFTMSGFGGNTAAGADALGANTSGFGNTASGAAALSSNTIGINNTAAGFEALKNNTSGVGNTVSGTRGLTTNTTGYQNSATGYHALLDNEAGANNVAVGAFAGEHATGSNNIYVGALVRGVAGESDTMYLGGTQTKTVIAGVRGTTVTGGEAVLIDANGRLGSGTVTPGADSVGSAQVIDESLTASDLAADSVTTSELAPSSVTADKVAFNYAGSSSAGGPATDLACIGCVAASEVSFSFASLGANTFTATQTIDTGNLDLDSSTATTGNVTKNGAPFLHNFGAENVFLGRNAGNFAMTGGQNTAAGVNALGSNTTGTNNTASGYNALPSNNTGSANTAFGVASLNNNTSGSSNTAVGGAALRANNGFNNTAVGNNALDNKSSGDGNTATGFYALQNQTAGNNNVAFGYRAGLFTTTGSNNIYLGANVFGTAGESNTMYLGNMDPTAGSVVAKAVIAGVRGTTVTGGESVLIDANGRLGSGTVSPGANSVGSTQVIDDSLTASDLGPDSVSTSELAPDSVTAAKVAFNYAGSTLEGGPATDLACVGCVAASEVSFSFASLGANTFTATQTIDTGNLDLDSSTATTGNITKNGQRFLHNFGTNNMFVGLNAGNTSMTGFGKNTGVGTSAFQSNTIGDSNTAIGYQTLVFNTEGNLNTATGTNALFKNTTGGGNTASGAFAMNFNTTGDSNTATGYFSLSSNLTGSNNTAFGASSLESNSAGSGNTAIGINALRNNTGDNNVSLGRQAGVAGTNGSYNIYIGADVLGAAGESNTMYLGRQGTQTKTVIAGIRGTTVTGGEMVVIDANGRLGSGAVAPGANSVGSNEVVDDSLTASDLGPDSVTTSELAADSVTAAKVAFNYAGSASEGGAATDLACVGCVAASEVSFSFASLGANTFTATQTIDTGNLDLDPSTATTGNITKNGSRFLHNFGTNNTFVGMNSGTFISGAGNTAVGSEALSSNFSGTANTASGYQALRFNSGGFQNTASGYQVMLNNTGGGNNAATGYHALLSNADGSNNVAMGALSLASNTNGNNNTALGYAALSSNTIGGGNTALGINALFSSTSINNTGIGRGALQNSTGSFNTALGNFAGSNATTGSNNIYLGSGVSGVSGDSDTMRLGGPQTQTFIAGIRGITTVNANAIPVMIDSAGQLGTVSSSRRFKEDIRAMGDTSRRLQQLRPVTFRYKQAFGDGSKPIQYGLVAEEVAEVFPELAVRSADGTVETVHYETLNVLLLNELQKQQTEMQRQQQRIDALEQRLNELIGSRQTNTVRQ